MKEASHGTDSLSVLLSGKSIHNSVLPKVGWQMSGVGCATTYIKEQYGLVFTVATQCGGESMSFGVRFGL